MNRISKSIGFSFLIVFAASFSFGYWIKIKQLNTISDRLLSHYPVSWFATTIFQVLLLFIVLWLVLAIILRSIDQSSKLNQLLLISAVPFLVFFIPLSDFTESTFAFQAQLFLVIAGVVLLRAFSRNIAAPMNIMEPVSALALLALVFLLLLQSFSPLFSINLFLDSFGKNIEWLNLEHQWEMTKAFDYSVPNFTQFAKLGGTTTGLDYFSELSSFLMLLLDIPIVDLEAKYTILKYMLFGLYFFASFGMYLFLRYGLDLSFIPSLIGGLGTVFGNGAITSFFGFEYISHHGDYLFLPWVFLFLKLGYKKNNIGFIGLAGLVSALGEYTLSAHPSLKILSYSFLNIYNIFLACTVSWNAEKWKERSRLFFSWVMIFPAFLVIGLAFRYLPMFVLSLGNDYGVTAYGGGGGLPWIGKLHHIASLFFHYETMGLASSHVGPASTEILFTTGQFIIFFIFSLFVYLFFRRAKSSPLRENDLPSQQDVWFFLVMFLLILINAWWGSHSPYTAVSKFFGIGFVHHFQRLNIYFFFFALITAMCGLHFLCKTKNTKILNVTFVLYIAVLGLMYFTPALTPVKPESKHLIFDGIVLIFIYKIFWLYLNLKKEPQGDQGHVFPKSLLLDLLPIIGFLFAIYFKWEAALKNEGLEWLMQNGFKLICIHLGVILVMVSFRSKLSFGKIFKTPLTLPLVAGKPHSFMTVGFPVVLNSLLFSFFLLGFSFLIPFRGAVVHLLTRDGIMFICIYLAVLFVIFLNWKSVRNEGHRVFIYPVIVLISLVTFTTQNDHNRQLLHPWTATSQFPTGLMIEDIPNTYISMRTAVTQYRNNTHDHASLNYLKTRWKQFIVDLKDKGKTEPSNFPLISLVNNSGLDSNSLEYYEKVSPLMDEFYLGSLIPSYFSGYFQATIHLPSMAPLVTDYYGASQYYLPDDYSLYFYGENQSRSSYPFIRPIGKNADINSYPYGTLCSHSHLFPSIKIYFHLAYIYNKPVPDISMGKWKASAADFEHFPFPCPTVLTKIPFDNSFTRKLINIIGLDYFLYREEGYPDLEHKLKAVGFIPTNLAESVRVKVLKNPDSYGRAYIADWVKTLKPEEDFKNRYGSFNTKSEWAWDLSLQKNFLDVMASIPSNYSRATLIESTDSDEYSPEPTIHSNESQVDILKILATKAMFEIDAKEDNTWFVYNSAALKGWRAFSGSKEVPIRKANLGFMGIKLNKGQHLVWMEYRPVSLFIGLTVTLGGWIVVTLCLLRHPTFNMVAEKATFSVQT